MSQLPSRVSSATPVSTPPSHLRCSSCSHVLFNACQTPHGCRLCQTCVTDLPVAEKRRCPGNTETCKDESEEIEVSQTSCLPDMATRREVARLQVRCPNCQAGCEEALKWAQMDRHLDSCDFHTLLCELCNRPVMRRDMQRHESDECERRKVTCDKCSQQVVLSERESRHWNLESDECCVGFSAHCPHCRDGRRKLDRRAYVAHLAECPEKPVDCKYAHLGCTTRVRRAEMETHCREMTDFHLELVDARLRQAATVPAGAPSSGAIVAVTSEPDSQNASQVKRQVDSVYDHFKKLQINVANWAHSTMELEQMAERFGGISQLRPLLTRLDDRTRCVEQLQQQVQQLQQQVQQLQAAQVPRN